MAGYLPLPGGEKKRSVIYKMSPLLRCLRISTQEASDMAWCRLRHWTGDLGNDHQQCVLVECWHHSLHFAHRFEFEISAEVLLVRLQICHLAFGWAVSSVY